MTRMDSNHQVGLVALHPSKNFNLTAPRHSRRTEEVFSAATPFAVPLLLQS
jgi:hypothetical protein